MMNANIDRRWRRMRRAGAAALIAIAAAAFLLGERPRQGFWWFFLPALAGFWLVNQYFGMTVPQTLKSWSAMKVMISICGFAIVLLAQWLIPWQAL